MTKGELLFGLAKLPDAKRLHPLVREFPLRVDVQPWDTSAAEQYTQTRVGMKKQGNTLAPLDLPIATHALSASATLVTNN